MGLSESLFSEVTITTPLQNNQVQSPHVLIRDKGFEQRSDTKACGSIACAVIYYLVKHKKEKILNTIPHMSRPLVLYLVTCYMEKYKECLFDDNRTHPLCETNPAYGVYLQFISFGMELKSKVII